MTILYIVYADPDGGFSASDTDPLGRGDTVRVVWTADDGDRSATLFERDVN